MNMAMAMDMDQVLDSDPAIKKGMEIHIQEPINMGSGLDLGLDPNTNLERAVQILTNEKPDI